MNVSEGPTPRPASAPPEPGAQRQETRISLSPDEPVRPGGLPVPGVSTSQRSGLTRWAWVSIPLLLLTMAVLWVADLRGAYESASLLLVLNFVCSMLASFCIAWLVARSFLVRPWPGLLLLGCGVISWGVAGLVGVVSGIAAAAAGGQLDINLFITIHNLCVWLSAACHLAGAVFSLGPRRELRAAKSWLTAAFTLALGTVGLVTLSACAHWTPLFFVQGQGGSLARFFTLGSAVAMFVLSAALLGALNRKSLSPFAYWYTLALGLIAVGLFGIMIESVHASPLSWTGRGAQFLSGLYMLMAAIALVRETGAGGLTLALAPGLSQARYRYAVAVAMVAASAALRLALLQSLGTRAAFITFYPAVMLAALYGGFRSGLLSTLLSGAVADYFWMEPVGHFTIRDPADGLSLGIFLLSGLMISWITDGMRRAQARIAQAETEAKVAAERAQAAETLRESRDRLAAFASATFEGIVESEAGRIVDCNEQFARMLGYTVAELRGMEMARLIAPEDLERVSANVRQGRDSAVEHGVVGKDGRRFIVEAHGWPVSPGSARRHTALRDITERKRAQETLQRFELLARNSRDIILFVRYSDGRIIQANEAALQAYRYTENELLGLCIQALRAPADVGLAEQQMAQADGAGILFEAEHCRKDGTRFSAEVSSQGMTIGGQRILLSVIRDITERKRAKEALQESEERLKLVLQASATGTFEVDLQTGEARWNDTEFELLGLRPGEVRADPETWFRHVHPEDSATVRVHWGEALRTGIFDLDFRIVRADGVLRWIAGRGRFFFAGQAGGESLEVGSQPLRFMGVNFDITERKQAEDALRVAEERYRSLFEHMLDGCAFCRVLYENGAPRDFIYLNVNSAFERLTGLEDVTGKKVSEVIPGVHQVNPELLECYGRVALTGQPERFESYLESSGIWFSIAVYSPLEGHFVAVFDDITARKRAEEALRQRAEEALRMSEEEFRSLAEAMPQIVWATRTDGWNIYFNQQWVDYTGMTMEESYGHGWNTPFHPDDKQRAWEAWQRAVQHNEPYSLECRLRRADGVYRWWLIRGEPMRGANGEILKWFGTCTDIEDIKRAEAALREGTDLLEQRVAERTAALQESEERHRLLAETMLQGVVHQDAAGAIIAMNPAAEAILGKSREQFVGSCSVREEHDTIREDGSPFPGREHPAMVALRTGQIVSGVVMGVWNPRQGAYRWISIDAVPLLRPGETRPAEVYTVFEDITERKQAEEAMRASERRYSALFANKINGMAHCRTITNEQGQPVDYTILQINEAYERIIGIKKADIEGRRATEVFPDIRTYAVDYIGMYGKLALEGGGGQV